MIFRNLIKFKKRNKEAIIVVMGCYSQVTSSKIDADIVIGNKDKSLIIDYLKEYLNTKKPIKKIYNFNIQGVSNFV